MSPLRGIKVLDLSRLLPGPYATQLLVDLGATVTKIENSQTGGDPLRYYAPICSDGNGAMFHAVNRGKNSVALPFRGPGSDTTRAEIQCLMSDADVVVESFRPGTFERLIGMSTGDLLRANPRLVLARLSGYGSGGGGRGSRRGEGDIGHDLNFTAAAGILDMSPVRGAPLPVQVADLAGGSWPAALQIVAALYRRDCRGAIGTDAMAEEHWKERLVDVKMALGAHSMLALPLARHAASGERVGGGSDFLAGGAAPYGVYIAQCGGHVALAALEPHFWRALCRVTGMVSGADQGGGGGGGGGGGDDDDDDAEYPRMDDPLARQNLDAIFLSKSAQEWERVLVAAGVPATALVAAEESSRAVEALTGDCPAVTVSIPATPAPPLTESTDEMGEASEQQRGVVAGTSRKEGGQRLSLLRSPFSIGEAATAPGPLLGEHNDHHARRKGRA